MPDGHDAGVSTKAAGSPRRGRPPRATPEQIVDAAVTLVLTEPDEPLTMARVASAVGLTPMALYRHFKDRDELMDEVVGRILLERNAAIPREGPWQDQLRAWVLGGLEYLVPCAQIVQVVFAGGSSRWLHDAATLARILEQAGFADDELADLQVWIALSVGGYVMAEASLSEGTEHVGDLRRARRTSRLTTPIGWRGSSPRSSAPSTRCTSGSPTASSRRWRPRHRASRRGRGRARGVR